METQAYKTSQGIKKGTEKMASSQRLAKLETFKQYSWRYVPDEDYSSLLEICRLENQKLRAMAEC